MSLDTGILFTNVMNLPNVICFHQYLDFIIVLFQLSDQKSVKSWSLLHGISLTSPVLWDSKDDTFVTVVNNQV